jgi:hypothetical protein
MHMPSAKRMPQPRLALNLHRHTFMKTIAAVAMLCVAVSAASSAYTTKYRPSVTTLDSTTDFSKLKTYGWLDSHIVVDEQLHDQIVGAIDREFSALGMTRVPAASAEVVVTYAAYSRTDVNTKAHPIARDVQPTYAVGILVVSVLAPQNMKTLLELRGVTPVERASRSAAVINTVADMFKLFPRRRGH